MNSGFPKYPNNTTSTSRRRTRTVLWLLMFLSAADPAAAYLGGPIYLYGDSRALGRLDDVPHSIPALWNARHPERPMVNGGFGGRTTVGALANLRADLAHVQPSIVVFLLDINDYGFLGLTPEQTALNLLRLTRIARGHRTQVFVLSTALSGCTLPECALHPDIVAFKNAESASTARVEQLEQAWPRLRRVRVLAMRATLWPTFAAFRPYTTDGFHLNAAGNARVVQFLAHYL